MLALKPSVRGHKLLDSLAGKTNESFPTGELGLPVLGSLCLFMRQCCHKVPSLISTPIHSVSVGDASSVSGSLDGQGFGPQDVPCPGEIKAAALELSPETRVPSA